MAFFQWIMNHKKKLFTLLAMIAALVYGVLTLIPGDQHEEAVKGVQDKIEKIRDALPEDPADAAMLRVDPGPAEVLPDGVEALAPNPSRVYGANEESIPAAPPAGAVGATGG